MVQNICRLALILLPVFLARPFSSCAAAPSAIEVSFPEHANIVHVTRPPYNAKGDGVTDDTEALQRALNENVGRHRILYFPNGTYLVSATLQWPKKWESRDNWGYTWLQGQSAEKCVIRLKDATFTDARNPAGIMWCGGFGSADWFHNHVQNLTFNVGRGNPGAIGLQFYANNFGAVRDCFIVSEDGEGAVGLDLAHRDMNGPLLVKRVAVRGFRRGIHTARAVNSQTFEDITLSGQTQFGFDNEGQAISIRGLASDNAVPALRSYGTLCLLDAKLTGRAGAEKSPALVNYNGGRFMARDIATTGYARALSDVGTPDFAAALRVKGADKPGSEGPDIAEYFSHPATSPFPTLAASLRLPVLEMPEAPPDDPKTWAVVDDFGADPTGKTDSTAAIQKAMDSGATTIFLPGQYALESTVTVGGKVSRITGTGGSLNYFRKARPALRIVAGASPALTIEHIAHLHGGIENTTDRTMILRSLGADRFTSLGRGDVFFEDVTVNELSFTKQRVFARQLNVENKGTHLVNDGGRVWVLGCKTERGGTLVETRNGGTSEFLGGFSYTTNSGKLAPMFVNDNSSVFAFFGEVCYSGEPFETLIRETRGGVTKEVAKGAGGTWPYVGVP